MRAHPDQIWIAPKRESAIAFVEQHALLRMDHIVDNAERQERLAVLDSISGPPHES